jgi:hypothetical protein
VKRKAAGGAHRGPVAPTRQRRALRSVQACFAVLAVVLFVFAAASLRDVGDRRGDDLAPGRERSVVQPVVLGVLGLLSLGAALALRAPGGGVRLPTPARLEEILERDEQAHRRATEEEEEKKA